MPLHGRAARVLELAALREPGGAEARELAGWADPRATAVLLRLRPAAAGWGPLRSTRRNLLLTDERAGTWPAAPFLEHLAATAPKAAGLWLADHAAEARPGRPRVLGALLRLADAGASARPGCAGCSRTCCLRAGRRGRPKHADVPRRLVAGWAGTSRCPHGRGLGPGRRGALLKDAVDLGHRRLGGPGGTSAGARTPSAVRCPS
ncbi:hypothetical protein [Streptomyces sp. MMBL 11-1]|uniref:hypothetical protein n=1 Tax=Streptomyces sp. MMBL 11-1 TaxID=3026420 RepID=UPI00235DF78C|nr:hypothetical protein [Streptomyces sp. MMBL 11-1]